MKKKQKKLLKFTNDDHKDLFIYKSGRDIIIVILKPTPVNITFYLFYPPPVPLTQGGGRL